MRFIQAVLIRSLNILALAAVLAACQGNPHQGQAFPAAGGSSSTPGETAGVDQPTIPLTATPTLHREPTASLPPIPASLPPAPSSDGSLSLDGQELSALAISASDIYWVSKQDPQELFSAPLSNPQSGHLKPVAKSRFITGDLGSMPVIARGDWLLFLDQAFNATNPLWRLRALNLRTGQDRLLDEAGGNRLARIYSFSSDGRQAAWIVQDRVFRRTCEEESSIFVTDLEKEQVSRVIRTCAATETQWIAIQVEGARIIASGIDPKSGNQSRIALFDLPSNELATLSDRFPGDGPSYPALSSAWAAWQTGAGATRVVYPDGSHPQLLQSLPDGQPAAAPMVWENWVGWLPIPNLFVYSLESNQFKLAASPGNGEKIILPAMGEGWIAWCRESLDGAGKVTNSQIEWLALDRRLAR